ncbi:MAG: ribonuclease J, partial [Clostridia bacterium]|nr:ribonuclease J [Clostridia bacterium]
MAKALKVGFLGGVGEIGKNMTILEYGESLIIIDSGLTFPTEEMPGIDIVIPSMQYVRENKARIKGIFLTHGHEDHIGSMPFLMEDIDAPIYASELTLKLVEHKLRERGIKNPNYCIVKPGDTVDAGEMKVEFFHMCHSIAGAFALAIYTPKGIVFHSGDFKIDYTPVDGGYMNFGKLGQLGDRGVLLMLGESTNVEREGHTVSERVVGETIDKIFAANEGRRIILATFASNVHRLQQVIEIALKYDRYIAFNGRSMLNVAEIGKALGILKVSPDRIIDLDRKSKKIPEERMVILSTGSQGEPMSALTRMATGKSNRINVGKNDTIIISASPI